MTNEELERAVERVAQMATDLEEFEYLNPPRAQASCDLRALLSERAELLAAVERMRGALMAAQSFIADGGLAETDPGNRCYHAIIKAFAPAEGVKP